MVVFGRIRLYLHWLSTGGPLGVCKSYWQIYCEIGRPEEGERKAILSDVMDPEMNFVKEVWTEIRFAGTFWICDTEKGGDRIWEDAPVEKKQIGSAR